jgi:hypothetical protein
VLVLMLFDMEAGNFYILLYCSLNFQFACEHQNLPIFA